MDRRQLKFNEIKAKFNRGFETTKELLEDERVVAHQSVIQSGQSRTKETTIEKNQSVDTPSICSEPTTPIRRAPPVPTVKEFTSSKNISSLSIMEETTSNFEDEQGGDVNVKSVINQFNKLGLYGTLPKCYQHLNNNNKLKKCDESEISNVEMNNIVVKTESGGELAVTTCVNSSTIRRCPTDAKFDSILEEMRAKIHLQKLETQNGLLLGIGKMRRSNKKLMNRGCASEAHNFNDHRDISTKMVKRNTEPIKFEAGKYGSSPSISLRVPAQEDNNNKNTAARLKTISMASSQSGSTNSGEDCSGGFFTEHSARCCYNTGNEKEDKRLGELHSVVEEFFVVQKNYVELLQLIGNAYPEYLEKCQEQLNCKWLISPDGPGCPVDVITRICNHLKIILSVHEMFLSEFAVKLEKWNSLEPNFADVFIRRADFLKICSSFLQEKRSLDSEFQQFLEGNPQLAFATKTFEQKILNAGQQQDQKSSSSECRNAMNLRGFSIAMQLDSVHQNVVRYRILMERYRELLPESSCERKTADDALEKLNAVSKAVNEFLAGADASKKLIELHRKLSGLFDVFAPGRKLLFEGELLGQTRKELQPRYLILFSDTLLICRYSALGGDNFDANRLYINPIERVQLRVEEHDEYEREFTVLGPRKSGAFVAANKREKSLWVQNISEAKAAAEGRNTQRKKLSKAGGEGGGIFSTLNFHRGIDECFYSGKNTLDADSAATNNNGHLSPPLPVVDGRHISPCDFVESEPIKRRRHSPGFESGDEAVAPSWMPDEKATKCLMAGCDTNFSFLTRKHHCRRCGCLICSKCMGYAPVKKGKYASLDWKMDKVCPPCFQKTLMAFEKGTFFPPCMLKVVPSQAGKTTASSASDLSDKRYSLNDPSLRISYGNGARLVPPSDLFVKPQNELLERVTIEEIDSSGGQLLQSGKIFFMKQRGVTVECWARLSSEFYLNLYKAEYDKTCSERFFIYGYSVDSRETEEHGTVIELTHRNQMKTERKEEKIVFHVRHSGSAEKWLNALTEMLAFDC